MSESWDLLLKGGRCVEADGEEQADLAISGGRIAARGALDASQAREVIDCTGLHLLPGVIDTQVHFREPGMPQKEDLEHGMRGAAAGGVTGIFEMPNTDPTTTTQEALDDKFARAKGRAWCDYAFYVGASPDNIEALPELERTPGCCGVKIFMGSSTGKLLVPDDETVLAVLRSGRRICAVHSEDEERLKERRHLVEGGATVHQHPVWRDVESAARSTRRLLALARKAGRPVHVLHVTTKDEMELLRDKPAGISVEVTPQHLTLFAPDCYDRLGTLAQMNPPIRSAEHREALWEGVRRGTVDVIGSDHAPHTLEEKGRQYPNTPSGMTGVQTLVPIMLDHVNAGRLTLQRFVQLTSATPARLFGIQGRGSLQPGMAGAVTVVDMDAERVIENDWIESRCGWTPFHGTKVKGWPRLTILGGRIIMRDGELLGEPSGQPFSFAEPS